jgi:hypothetical protein
MTTPMSTAEEDLSTFALDVYWASGRPPDPAIERHLAACDRCRAYLAMLDARQAALVTPAPGAPAPRRSAILTNRNRWLWPATGAVALAAAILLLVRGRPPSGDYVGTKGSPAVQVLVHREGDTRVWDGRSPVKPGDALALRVACEGLVYVTVAAPLAGAWARLSDSPCPAQPDALPFTLRVDDEPGSEQFAVVLSSKALSDEALHAAIDKDSRSQDTWVTRYVLPKETGTTEP